MSSPVNEVTIYSYDSVEYTSPGYPISTASAIWNISTAPHNSQQWTDPPPSYDTLADLPTWSVPQTPSELHTPPTNQQWNMQAMSPTHNVPSTSQILNPPCTAKQWNTLSPACNIPSSSPALNDSTDFPHQNTDALISQRTTHFKQRFRNGKPRALGILLILAAFVQLGTGIGLAIDGLNILSKSLSYGAPFWAPMFYIISGSLLIGAWFTPSTSRVKTLVSCNFITLAISSVGLVFNFLDLHEPKCSYATYFLNPHHICQSLLMTTHKSYFILIATNVLAFLLSFSSACIGTDALSYNKRIHRSPPP